MVPDSFTLKLTFEQLELARLETLRIKKLLDEELQKTFDLPGSSSEGQSDHLKQEDFDCIFTVQFAAWKTQKSKK